MLTANPLSFARSDVSFPWRYGFAIVLIILEILIFLAVVGFGIYLTVLLVKALRKYLASGEVRQETAAVRLSLGEALKAQRMKHNMTQEFVAEHLGVSRQAVSKWENGTSDPSTANLLALAKLYDISAADLLREVES